ncbi:MAG: YdcF family protein [Pseudomonadota bacterium]|jgi:uncharacterized SAM-binding protein YcdF (DUF218 family)
METLPLTFLLKKFAAALLLPPLLPLLAIFAGLLLLRRRPKLGRTLAWGGLLVAWLLSTPVVVNLITTPLEDVPVLQPQDLARGEAIVILGAGAHRFMPEYGGPGPNRLALERLRFGARLARASGLPVLVSGEAGPMTDSLRADFGVAPDWLEGGSLDTEDNARNTVEILRGKAVERIVLVTHAAHMRRSMAEFAAQGIEVIPAPTGFFSRFEGDEPRIWFLDYLPGPAAAYAAWFALHEWAGLLALKLRVLTR